MDVPGWHRLDFLKKGVHEEGGGRGRLERGNEMCKVEEGKDRDRLEKDISLRDETSTFS